MPAEWWSVVLAVVVVLLPATALMVGVHRRRDVLAREAALANEAARLADRQATDATRVPTRRPVAVVVNPTKVADVEALRRAFRVAADRAGRPDPIWLETTAHDPGRGQAREALRRGASTVVAAGGDGTVRAVAEVLAGTGTPMGIIPVGTGNLLARNLRLPLDDRARLVEIATTAPPRPIDVGWLHVGEDDVGGADGGGAGDGGDGPGNPDGERRTGDGGGRASNGSSGSNGKRCGSGGRKLAGDGVEEDSILADEEGAGRDGWHAFTVIAGMGWDADMVHETRDELKARLGWIAYFVGGLKNTVKKRLKVSISIDDGPAEHAKVRTVMFANCGLLPGNLVLSPGSAIDDGVLEVVTVDTRYGLLGWADLSMSVLRQTAGQADRKEQDPAVVPAVAGVRDAVSDDAAGQTVERRAGTVAAVTAVDVRPSKGRAARGPRRRRSSELLFTPARAASVEAAEAVHVQLDGDLLSTTGSVTVKVEHGALQMRYPGRSI